MSASTRDMHLAMGMPDPGDSDAAAEGTEADTGSTEEEEDEAIDDMFAAKDPVARREAFRRAVKLCTQGGY